MIEIDIINTKQDIIDNHAKKISELTHKLDIAVNVLEEIDKFKDREFKGNQTILTVLLNNWLMAHKALKEIRGQK